MTLKQMYPKFTCSGRVEIYQLKIFIDVNITISCDFFRGTSIFQIHACIYFAPKADPGPAHRARTPCLKIFLVFIFVNFDCLTRIYINRCLYAMCTICISFFTLTTKT